MNAIKLIRNKWFLLTFSLFYAGILWFSFQMVYKNELLLRALYKNPNPPDALQALLLYGKMMKSEPNRHELNPFYCLAKILVRAEKKKEAINVLNRLVKVAPEDRKLRLWLAIELHNQQRYKEAEKHFVVLLREKRMNPAL